MTWVLISLLILVLVGLGWVLVHLKKTPEQKSSILLMQQQLEAMRDQLRLNMESSASLMQKHLGELTQQINERLRDSNTLLHQSQKTVGERLDTAARVVGELKGKLGKLEEANVRIFEVGKDIRSLQDILRAPKLRGSLGEFFLADLLSQTLPREHFELQHAFKNNEKVDAVIRLGEQWVPVDAKFPLENFQRVLSAESDAEKKALKKVFVSDVKKHIEAIAQKYIRPDEGTFDFALMYVPAENVYYEIIVKDDLTEGDHVLSQYAMSRRVIPVSPNTLYVYLNTIVLGLKGLRIEKAAKEILTGLSRLGGDLEKISESFRKVGLHLNHAQGAYEDSQNRLGKFGDRMERLHGESGEEVVVPIQEEQDKDKVRLLTSSSN